MSQPLPPAYVLRNGLVVDGTGRDRFPADVLVEDGRLRVAAPRTVGGVPAVDVDGLTITPGFIDVHSHADLESLLGPGTQQVHASRVLQGVTTEVAGNCGFSPFPFPPERADAAQAFLGFVFGAAAVGFSDHAAYTDAVTGAGLSCNLAPLVGHGTLRVATLGYEDRAPSTTEREAMSRMLEAALDAGAFGMSTGLCYTPATFAEPAEVEELARVVARAGGVYATHVRNETEGVFDAIREALAVARATGVGLHVSHLKAAGRRMWGASGELLVILEAARVEGIDVTADVYPYTAASTMLHSLLPPWLANEGIETMLRRLADPGTRETIATHLESGIPGWQNLGSAAGWDAVTVASSPRRPEREGRSIVELGGAGDRDTVDTIARLLIEEEGRVIAVIEAMDNTDVRTLLAWPHTLVGSDGIPLPGKPHPRLTGTFPRALGRYRDTFGTLPQAVHRMTGASAARFGIPDRGVVADGRVADLVVLDPDTVNDRGTFSDPWLEPAGIHHVLIGGRAAVWDDELVDAAAGSVLRRA
ncbi:MAG TPA: D-aminoacylase [Acidimicrobiia bacterium]|nr:D-aminoacylase [Acidimicrobiia bacterium]